MGGRWRRGLGGAEAAAAGSAGEGDEHPAEAFVLDQFQRLAEGGPAALTFVVFGPDLGEFIDPDGQDGDGVVPGVVVGVGTGVEPGAQGLAHDPPVYAGFFPCFLQGGGFGGLAFFDGALRDDPCPAGGGDEQDAQDALGVDAEAGAADLGLPALPVGPVPAVEVVASVQVHGVLSAKVGVGSTFLARCA